MIPRTNSNDKRGGHTVTGYKVESLLSARLFMSPQLVGKKIYFLSNMSGRISLYRMDRGGSVPEPLLPPDIALQNPILLHGATLFKVFPKMCKILVMLDKDGDENYQPCFIPMEGGIPERLFGDRFEGKQVLCAHADIDKNIVALLVDPRTDPNYTSYLVNLKTMDLTDLGTSIYGNSFGGANDDYSKIILIDSYTAADHALYLWTKEAGERKLVYGKPIDQREEGEKVPLNNIHSCYFTEDDKGLFFATSLFDDRYGLGYFELDDPGSVKPVEIRGTAQTGEGVFEYIEHIDADRYVIVYNIDGCSYAYEGTFAEGKLKFEVCRLLCGEGKLGEGVLQSLQYDKDSGDYAAAFSKATSPIQIYTIEDSGRKVVRQTNERVLGVPPDVMSSGEDASYTSHDGLRVSARLYMPSPDLGFEGKRPIIFYIHGGPQSQERPDFAWFSMPLIQFFTLNGFAVFVPNVRGSSGYGLDYMKRVDKDWGGQDRLDHVHACEHLKKDDRLDVSRAGVMGRSYGGYMTLMLAGRHPDLWKAACDMFGPYNLVSFVDRIPETWKTHFYMAIGHPEKDRDELMERSPSTYLPDLSCPLFVIQGKNDPRVREIESRDVVEELRAKGKDVEYLVFENEGHDVIKFENKVKCYNEIVEFFSKHLTP
jgi:pimeloyl-ACP methyl ester carboxylesterase